LLLVLSNNLQYDNMKYILIQQEALMKTVQVSKKLKRTTSSIFAILLMAVLFFNSVSVTKAQDDPPPTPGIDGRIIGGVVASNGEIPWQVALVGGASVDLFQSQFCGGSLIHPQWVLTAAHCITELDDSVTLPANVDVVAGINNLSTGVGFQRRDVTQIIRHPSYVPATYDNDIALMKLSSPITIGGSGQGATAVIPLVSASVGTLEGVNSLVTGWGNTSTVSSSYPTDLYKVVVPVVSNTLCNDANHYGGAITSNMLCAGYDVGGYDSCQGDSGGPLAVVNSGQFQLAGVVSWGNGCAQPFRQGVYARVSQYIDWVNSSIGTSLVNSVLPTSRSVAVGTTATIFNTVINAGATTATGVTLSINPAPAGTFVYQQTDCVTNAVLGLPNPSLNLAPGGVLCYVLSFTPSATFAATSVHIQAQASNALNTNLLTGINTWLLRANASAGPDIIALTTTTDFHQVACSGANAFAVALSNVGAAATGDITVTANTGSAVLPVSVSIMETDPGTGAVIGDNILQGVGAGANRTVAVFVTFNGCISFDPAVNRIFIEFRDSLNNVVGSTSTAVSTNR
jgi:secreted trypsin-like serine protease